MGEPNEGKFAKDLSKEKLEILRLETRLERAVSRRRELQEEIAGLQRELEEAKSEKREAEDVADLQEELSEAEQRLKFLGEQELAAHKSLDDLRAGTR